MRREAAEGDWRTLYFGRRKRDQEVLVLLRLIREDRSGRHARARQIVQEYGFDVWDALREEASLPLPAWVQDSAEHVDTPPDVLPRRYWAQVVLGVIARHSVMRLWATAAAPKQTEVDFEHGLAGLSAFFDVSLKEVCRDAGKPDTMIMLI